MSPEIEKASATMARAVEVAIVAASAMCSQIHSTCSASSRTWCISTLHDRGPNGLSQDLGGPYRVVRTGRGGGSSHELKRSSRLTQPT